MLAQSSAATPAHDAAPCDAKASQTKLPGPLSQILTLSCTSLSSVIEGLVKQVRNLVLFVLLLRTCNIRESGVGEKRSGEVMGAGGSASEKTRNSALVDSLGQLSDRVLPKR